MPTRLRRCRASSASSIRGSPINEPRSSSPLAGAAFGTLAALIWAGFPAITKLSMGNGALDAWDVTALRFGVGGIVLLPLLARLGLRGLGTARALFIACCAGAPYVLLTAGGLAFAPAGHMGVITPSTMLLCATLGSAWLLGEPLSRSQMLGVTAIVVGLIALGWDGLANHGELTWLGDAMFLLGGLFWASYTLASRAWRVEPLHATAVVAVISMALYVPPYAWLAGADLAAAPWREIAIQAVFQGVLSAVIALLFYTRAVAILGAARGAVFAALVPAFSLLLAVPLLHELPTRLQLAGVGFVSAGMVLALGLHDPQRWRAVTRAMPR
jgi:drug/metabolite transporter (DMT)-like permease